METHVLMGAEDVARAGRQMAQAAAEMQSAASQISYALQMHQQFMLQWLADFQQAMPTPAASPRVEPKG